MAGANVKTNKIVRPVIYCFTTPNDRAHDGYCKIGYTDRYTADECIYQESRRTDTFCKKEWEAPAIFDTSSYTTFTDHDFHNYLDALGIERKESVYDGKRHPEYYKIAPERAKELLNKFREMTDPVQLRKAYKLRDEQQEAVDLMLDYMKKSARKDVLLNAKPRFGKTLTVYDYCKKINAEKILIVTNRPVIATSWYNDYIKFLGTDEYLFVSNCDAVKDKEFCLSSDQRAHSIFNNLTFLSL